MRPIFQRLQMFFLAGAALLFGTAAPLRAIEVKPPFGLNWGETQDKLTALLDGAQAKVVEKRELNDKEIWTVEGLLQPRLRRTLFYFREKELTDVELQYEDASWDVPKYDEFLSDIRRRIEQIYGPGTLIARQKGPDQGVSETIVGYQWNMENGSLQLFYYAAEKPPDVFRTVSVHYKSSATR
ncbi:MAG TPA: hypothetical protein VIT91_09010 [Chthoniobacterales bacterium]